MSNSTLTGMASSFAIPLIRRVFPQLVVSDILGVQPMSAPVGLSFALNYTYGGNGITLIPYSDKNTPVDYTIGKSVVGVEYKPNKVKVVRDKGFTLKRPRYMSKQKFQEKYFTEAI